MTREELDSYVRSSRKDNEDDGDFWEAIRELADERDASMAALRDEEKKTYAAMRETHDARLQRDRALALLQGGTYERCTSNGRQHCPAEAPCWDCRRRALLAEVYK